MALLHIIDKYINHLSSLERMLEHDKVIYEKYLLNRDKTDLSMMDLIDMVIDVKSKEQKNEDLDSEEFKKSKELLEEVISAKNGKFVYDNIEITMDEDGDTLIHVKNTFLRKFFNDQIENHKNLSTDVTQLRNSIIISLVTSLELLIGDLIRDYILNIDKSDFLDKRSITYTDLLKIGDIEEAKNFLLDKYIEELLRSSFVHWIDELERKTKIKISQVDTIKQNDDIGYINETFQRRHLLIHNDGIVNDLYLTKTSPIINEGVSKGDMLENSTEYIINRIKLFKKFGVILVYLYSKKKYKEDIDVFFVAYNELLLTLASEGCYGARYVYNAVSNDDSFNHSSRLMSEINYFLSHKLVGDFPTVQKEVEEFYVDTLSVEFKMAKSILLDNFDEAFEYFKEYTNSISNDEFFYVIDWPLINLLKDSEKVDKYIQNKINHILSNGEGELVEEHSYS